MPLGPPAPFYPALLFYLCRQPASVLPAFFAPPVFFAPPAFAVLIFDPVESNPASDWTYPVGPGISGPALSSLHHPERPPQDDKTSCLDCNMPGPETSDRAQPALR